MLVEGAVRRIEVEEVQCAMNRMKIEKEGGPSGVAIELFKAGGDKCLKFLTNLFNDILFKDTLLEKWILSSLVPIFKGKGDPLNPDSYRGGGGRVFCKKVVTLHGLCSPYLPLHFYTKLSF